MCVCACTHVCVFNSTSSSQCLADKKTAYLQRTLWLCILKHSMLKWTTDFMKSSEEPRPFQAPLTPVEVNRQEHTLELLRPFHSTRSIQMSSLLSFPWTTHPEILNPSSEYERNVICASPNFHIWAFSDITYTCLILRQYDVVAKAWISELGRSWFKFQFCYLPSECPWANSLS